MIIQDTYDLLVAKNGTIYDLLVELKKKANLEEIIDHIRVTATNNGKIQKELDHNYPVTSVLDYYALYAERKPEEELNAKDGERLMAAFHFDKEISKTHGVPFKFLVKPVRLADFPPNQTPPNENSRERCSKTPKNGSRSERASRANNLRI